MRSVARLASVKLALLSLLGTTGWTTDSEYLLWAEFFFHRPMENTPNSLAMSARYRTVQGGGGYHNDSGQRFSFLANVGVGRPRHSLDNNDRDCDGSQFDSLVHRVNTDYRKTTCAAFHCYRLVVFGNASFKGFHSMTLPQAVTKGQDT
jgi:hypothetical protein